MTRLQAAQAQSRRLRAAANAAYAAGDDERSRLYGWRMNWLYGRIAAHVRAERLAQLRTCSDADALVGAEFLGLTLSERLALSLDRIEREME